MYTSEFDYELPSELIAQKPIADRDRSRLMVVNRDSGTITHNMFCDITKYIGEQDVLVVNNTRVIPARLQARRSTGGKIEVLLLKDLGDDKWECLVKPGAKAKAGEILTVKSNGKKMTGKVISTTSFGGRVISWTYKGEWKDLIEALGDIPLPPYIHEPLEDKTRYQTVYAQMPGSAAAPTAGLHFTPELLDKIRSMNVAVKSITLDVGLGTFRPVKEELLENHVMHKERFEISPGVAGTVNNVKKRGGNVIAVGTTVVRALESSASEGKVKPFSGETGLFIYPSYSFQVVDRLLTNFHLPKSTLLMLVCAFAGKELIMKAYKQAIQERYRFFSFGDAMLII
jgi:S-adenosylmethionine:tRNA ribosyltransferase-isomerase